ncbi:hypothetical protein [Leptobacterium sp. I13]|uniref:hypothetical protein n=1 Tax=Leptobacterium meishanense TaxID=3128904 RepID=UPI0030ED6EBC
MIVSKPLKKLFISFLLFTTSFIYAQEELSFEITVTSLPYEYNFDLPEGGYVLITYDEISGNITPQCEIYDFLKNSRGMNAARVDFGGNVTLRFHEKYYGSANPPLSFKAKITIYEEDDVLEPNDNIEEAVKIDFFTWYQAVLFPEYDKDFFKFEIMNPGFIRPNITATDLRHYWRLYNEEGSFITGEFPYYAEKGKYSLELAADYNYKSQQPLTFMLMYSKQVDELEYNDTIPAPIELGKMYQVNFEKAKDVDQIKISSEKPGVIHFDAVGYEPYRLYISVNGDQGNYGVPLAIPTNGQDDIVLTLSPDWYNWSDKAFLIEAKHQELLDPNEFNDSIAVSTPIKAEEVKYFTLYPKTDMDVFHVTTTGETVITANITDGLAIETPLNMYDYYLEVLNSNNEVIGPMNGRVSNYGILYTSPILKEAGEYYIRISSRANTLRNEQLLGLKLYGKNIEKASGSKSRGRSALYLVGIELDSITGNIMESLAEHSNVPYTAIDSTTNMATALNDVMQKAIRKDAHWFWKVLIVLVILTAGYFGYKKFKK